MCDTTCFVAAVSTWHECHEAVLGEIERRLDSGVALVVAGPALVEAYAVLSRMPAPAAWLPIKVSPRSKQRS